MLTPSLTDLTKMEKIGVIRAQDFYAAFQFGDSD
jgi:hypothetical protein